MAYILRQKGSNTNILCHYFECDEESDLSTINTSSAPMGSRCYVINSGNLYVLNSAKVWKKAPVPTGGSGGDVPSVEEVVHDGGAF